MNVLAKEVYLRDLHIRVEHYDSNVMLDVHEEQASYETMNKLNSGAIEIIKNYLGDLYGLKRIEGKGKLVVEFAFSRSF